MIFKLGLSILLSSYLATLAMGSVFYGPARFTTSHQSNLSESVPDVNAENHDGTKLNITVFYESLCPASVSFFKTQFSKNWMPFFDYINVILVPYGKATQTQDEKGNWSFVCQHGEEECYGNRIQACAISSMIEEQSKKLFTFISCYMSELDKEKYGPQCAHLVNIEFSTLDTCAKSKKGFELLAILGKITHNFSPKIKWIPTIVLNNKFNQTENDSARSDLKSLLCEKLENKPKECAD